MKFELSKLEHSEIAQEAMRIIKPIVSPTFNINNLSSNYDGDITIHIGYHKGTHNLMFLSDLSKPFINGGNKITINFTNKYIAIAFFKCLSSKRSLIIKFPITDSEGMESSIIL